MNKKCLVVSGGTAGHILPSLEIVRSLLQKGYKVHWLGHGEALEHQIQSVSLTYHKVLSRSPRSRILFNPAYWKLLASDIKTVRHLLKEHEFSFVLVTGNFIGLIPGFLSWLNSIPLYIYEQNSLLGQANRLLYPFSKKVFWGIYPQRKLQKKEFYTQQPLRSEIVSLRQSQQLYKEPSKEKAPTLLILGGSLGAHFFNTTLIEKLAQSGVLSNWQVIHCVGSKGNVKKVQYEYKKYAIEAIVLSYTHDMANLYEKSDAIIARAGALSLSEVVYLNKHALIIPMPNSVGDHQRLNTYSCLNHHNITHCEQDQLSKEDLEAFIKNSSSVQPILPQDKIAQLCSTN